MPQRLAGRRTMVRHALLQCRLQRRLQRLLRRHLRAALRTRNLAQPRTPTRLSGASRTRPAQGKGASRTPSAGAALAAGETATGCDGMTYTENYAEGTAHEC